MDGPFNSNKEIRTSLKLFVSTCLSSIAELFIALTVHLFDGVDLHPASDNSVTHVTIPVAAEAPIEVTGASRH